MLNGKCRQSKTNCSRSRAKFPLATRPSGFSGPKTLIRCKPVIREAPTARHWSAPVPETGYRSGRSLGAGKCAAIQFSSIHRNRLSGVHGDSWGRSLGCKENRGFTEGIRRGTCRAGRSRAGTQNILPALKPVRLPDGSSANFLAPSRGITRASTLNIGSFCFPPNHSSEPRTPSRAI